MRPASERKLVELKFDMPSKRVKEHCAGHEYVRREQGQQAGQKGRTCCSSTPNNPEDADESHHSCA